MNARMRFAVLAVISGAVLAALALTVPGPLLYSIEKDTSFSSPYHVNAEALKDASLNSTTDILPQMQDFIDFSGPVSLNIRIHDIEQARRDLERFERSHGSIKNLIIKLDMDESAIRDLEQNAALQRQILETLMNTSVTLESLQLMEIQYHSENNQDMLTTVRLQGDELRKRVKGLNVRYRNATEQVTSAGKKFGLNTTKNEESLQHVEQLIEQIERPQPTILLPFDTVLVPGDERVSLFLRPETGTYREVIEYMGISLTLQGNKTLRAEGKPIVIYLDEAPLSTVMTDAFGYYNARLPIERVSKGEHTVYARSPTARSVNRTLAVNATDSVTTLVLEEPAGTGNVNCTGTVLANFPVRSASVQIVWDKVNVVVTKTDALGAFIKEIRLPAGTHTIIARFNGDGYPINPSVSSEQIVVISADTGRQTPPFDWGIVLIILSAIGILVLSGAAARYYLERMERPKIRPVEPAPPDEFTPDDEPEYTGTLEELLEDEDDSLLSRYTRLVRTEGLSQASRKIYEHLARHVARDLGVKRYRTLTAREMSRTCRDRPYCGAFSRFVGIYERVRYGGHASVKDQTVFETAIHTTEDLMGGEED